MGVWGPGKCLKDIYKLAGESGKIYALDIHPLAIQKVKKMIIEENFKNVETIRSDCNTGLPEQSMDIILLYDVINGFANSKIILEELHRVLKPNGILSFSDHHMKNNEILSNITGNGFFRLLKKDKSTYSFVKGDYK